MSVWRSWDEDDDEYAERTVVRDLIPEPLESYLDSWLRSRLRRDSYWVAAKTVYAIQSSLHVVFESDPEYDDIPVDDLMKQIESRGEKFKLRVLDLLLAAERVNNVQIPPHIRELSWHLGSTASALTIDDSGSVYRLARRLPDGVEEIAQQSVLASNQSAGAHLSRAWTEAQGLEPDTSKVMTEAIRAVEAAAAPVVIPRDTRPTLGKIVASLRGRDDWRLVLQRRDDDVPDHHVMVIAMLETLAFAQRDRHAGEPPSVVEAQGHVQLASTLVAWFSTGVISVG
jgi:hypothetical protein